MKNLTTIVLLLIMSASYGQMADEQTITLASLKEFNYYPASLKKAVTVRPGTYRYYFWRKQAHYVMMMQWYSKAYGCHRMNLSNYTKEAMYYAKQHELWMDYYSKKQVRKLFFLD